MICKISEKNDALYGAFLSQDGISCHYFCLLFFLDLMPEGCDVKDMVGYKTGDIKKCIKRQKHKCHYCKKPGAAAVCCKKECRKWFHVPCAMKNNCLMHFFDKFESFCDDHAKEMIHHDELPARNEKCSICQDDLGEYNPVKCFRPPCCIESVKEKEGKNKAYWMHYECVMQGARNLGYHFNCFAFSCGKRDDKTRQGYKNCGIFIPDRDALYEDDDRYRDIDTSPDDGEDLYTTYDDDATLFERTFVPTEEIDCDYENRCIGSKLGKRDIVACHFKNNGCENFAHTKCLRYHRELKSNKAARNEKFYCKKCIKGSCLELI